VNNITRQVSWDWVMVGNQTISPGSLWNHSDHPGEVMQCPDYHGKSNFGEAFTGYNYNTGYIGGEAKPFGALGWKPVRQGVPPHACARASTCAMFGDAGRGNQSNKYMRGPLPVHTGDIGTCYSGAQAFRHSLCTNVAYVDGHVASVSMLYRGQHATDPLLSQMGYPHNGFLSDDDAAYDPR
jgi:prepilin-type processing-associated H-X9-DG protein